MKNSDNCIVAEVIKSKLESEGITYRQLQRVGFYPAFVSQVLRDNGQTTSIRKLSQFADHLGIPMSAFWLTEPNKKGKK